MLVLSLVEVPVLSLVEVPVLSLVEVLVLSLVEVLVLSLVEVPVLSLVEVPSFSYSLSLGNEYFLSILFTLNLFSDFVHSGLQQSLKVFTHKGPLFNEIRSNIEGNNHAGFPLDWAFKQDLQH